MAFGKPIVSVSVQNIIKIFLIMVQESSPFSLAFDFRATSPKDNLTVGQLTFLLVNQFQNGLSLDIQINIFLTIAQKCIL